jgi:hypothetical protein
MVKYHAEPYTRVLSRLLFFWRFIPCLDKNPHRCSKFAHNLLLLTCKLLDRANALFRKEIKVLCRKLLLKHRDDAPLIETFETLKPKFVRAGSKKDAGCVGRANRLANIDTIILIRLKT